MALEAPWRSCPADGLDDFASRQRASALLSMPSTLPSELYSYNNRNPALAAPAVPAALGSEGVGPLPITSAGTDVTASHQDNVQSPLTTHSTHPRHPKTSTPIQTDLAPHILLAPEDLSTVIHAPQEFQKWVNSVSRTATTKYPSVSETPEQTSNHTTLTTCSSSPPSRSSSIRTPPTIKATTFRTLPQPQEAASLPPTRPTIYTNVSLSSKEDGFETPMAQDLSNLSGENWARFKSTLNLQNIEEAQDQSTRATGPASVASAAPTVVPEAEWSSELTALLSALRECWTLCNTLAGLSSIHRRRVFHSSGTPDANGRAWQTCWQLCRQLYHNLENDQASYDLCASLELCRDFSQALFDIRLRKDKVADSILRVSFELNNHLYSAQDDESLPSEFRERTLDFYITICHRLMRQRGDLNDETDTLLNACWSLTEVLFSLRQCKRDSQPLGEALLSFAVQACWDLCDIFRKGWSQVRPDRSTPRATSAGLNRGTLASRRTDSNDAHSSKSSVVSPSSRHSAKSIAQSRQMPAAVPPTPITILDDTPMSPLESPELPNILVLGPMSHRKAWSSNVSDASGYGSRSSLQNHTSSRWRPDSSLRGQ